MKKLSILLSLFLFASTANVFAQRCWGNYDWDFDFEFESDTATYHPFVEINYGILNSYFNTFSGKFNENGFAKFNLGYRLLENLDDSTIVKLKSKSFFVNYASSTIATSSGNPSPIKPNIEIWQGGFGWTEGYGYRLGAAKLVFTSGNSLVWNRLRVVEPDIRTFAPIDQKGLERFDRAIRFGVSNSAGINITVSKHFNLNADYVYGMIFPRYLIWKHFGSFVIEMAGEGLIENFVDEVYDFAPAATPLLNFILKNAFSYAFFNLEKDKSFYPFNSENPFYYKALNFGVTVVF